MNDDNSNVLHFQDTNGNLMIKLDNENMLVNATAMCKSANKLWANYYITRRTKSFLHELSLSIKKTKDELIISQIGGNHSGTWVHPMIATDLACWCSPAFGVKVTLWIEEAKLRIPQVKKDWIKSLENLIPDTNKQVEIEVQSRLAQIEDGLTEVETKFGSIDILTDKYIIEVKSANRYKHAIGQILAYGIEYNCKQMRIHLFWSNEDELKHYVELARQVCEKLNIVVTYELYEQDEPYY